VSFGHRQQLVESTRRVAFQFKIQGQATKIKKNLIQTEDAQPQPPVRFRIFGRSALDGEHKPKISAPFTLPYLWAMMWRRLHAPDLKTPAQMDNNDPHVLENFKVG
jgi:hypothetical protein